MTYSYVKHMKSREKSLANLRLRIKCSSTNWQCWEINYRIERMNSMNRRISIWKWSRKSIGMSWILNYCRNRYHTKTRRVWRKRKILWVYWRSRWRIITIDHWWSSMAINGWIRLWRVEISTIQFDCIPLYTVQSIKNILNITIMGCSQSGKTK